MLLYCAEISCVGHPNKLIGEVLEKSWNLYHHVRFTVA